MKTTKILLAAALLGTAAIAIHAGVTLQDYINADPSFYRPTNSVGSPIYWRATPQIAMTLSPLAPEDIAPFEGRHNARDGSAGITTNIVVSGTTFTIKDGLITAVSQ